MMRMKEKRWLYFIFLLLWKGVGLVCKNFLVLFLQTRRRRKIVFFRFFWEYKKRLLQRRRMMLFCSSFMQNSRRKYEKKFSFQSQKTRKTFFLFQLLRDTILFRGEENFLFFLFFFKVFLRTYPPQRKIRKLFLPSSASTSTST